MNIRQMTTDDFKKLSNVDNKQNRAQTGTLWNTVLQREAIRLIPINRNALDPIVQASTMRTTPKPSQNRQIEIENLESHNHTNCRKFKDIGNHYVANFPTFVPNWINKTLVLTKILYFSD